MGEPPRPILSKKEMTPENLSAMIREYSCCVVRNLLSVSDVLQLRELAANTYIEFDQYIMADSDIATRRTETLVSHEAFQGNREAALMFRRFGGIPLVYCPPFASMLCTALERTAAPSAISAYLGARAGIGLSASSVRLSEHFAGVQRVFHQDGNFLGGYDSPSINCWVALDPCGRDAPGLEVFPFRIDRLLPAGQPGSAVPWEIDEDLAYDALGRGRSWTPEFQAGDAFIFDHTHVHRTHKTPEMTKSRHAIETWFFRLERGNQSKQLVSLNETNAVETPHLSDDVATLIAGGCRCLMDGDHAGALQRFTRCLELNPSYYAAINAIYARVNQANAEIEELERPAAATV